MNNIDLYIEELESVKVEIKDAIIAKGVTPTGGLSSYAAAIGEIDGATIETDDLGVLINENGSYYYTPEGDGFTSVAVTVDVIPPPVITQEKDVTITSNGDTIVTPDEGFDGLNKVNVSVKVPIPTFETETLTVELTENGTYNYTPTTDGYSSVEVTVDVAGSGGGGLLIVPFEEIGYPTELKDDINNELNSKPLSDLEYSKSLYTANTTYYNGDNKLVYAPLVNTSNIKNMGYMFQDCSSLTTVPLFNTGNATDMKRMFFGCNLLTSIPQFDTSNVTNMSYMFSECTNLTSIPQFDTSNVTNMSYMFSECTNLTSIPQLDTGKVTDMSYMFSECTNLTSIPQLDTGSVTTIRYMFNGCTNLTSIPQLDTGSVTTMSGMLTNCSKLTSIPQFDASKVTDIGLFGYSGNDSIVNLGGFVNLGMQKSVNKTNTNYFLGGSSKLTYESVMNVINNLYDRATAGYSVLTLKIHTNTMALLSADDIAIATNKGWILS